MRHGFFMLLLVVTTQAMAKPAAKTVKDYASVNGLKMYYEIHGSGEPLVLLHGGGSSIRTTFQHVLPLLAKNHRVIAVEQQGHGHTADIDRDFSFEQMADDTAKLLAHLKVAKADFFGFSNGGSVAMQIAVRHPQLVRQLIVASTVSRMDALPPGLLESFKKPVTPQQMPPALREDYLKTAPNPDRLQTQMNKLMKMMTSFKPVDVQKIQAPTLLLSGDMDVAPIEHLAELKTQIRGSRLAVFPGGHGEYIGEASGPLAPKAVIEGTVAVIEGFLSGTYPHQTPKNEGK